MANISRDSFQEHFVDNLKHYVSVRLQQGVPLVDADWNEREDVRKYELQAYLKWFVGNGVPRNNDGFAISAIAGANIDFSIRGGDGTVNNPGRCLVDGLDVIIPADTSYQNQPLYGNAALATALGVDPLPVLNPPLSGLIRRDTVYLDVWEREVIATVPPAEGGDPELIDNQIGVETCTRLKRDWVVRVAEGVEEIPEDDKITGHYYYPIASIIRRPGATEITDEDIIDRRRTGIYASTPDNFDQITADAFGQEYTLDNDGQPDLPVSLRDAINSLLKQELPSTDVQVLKNSAMHVDTTKDANGNLWIAWLTKNAATTELHFSRYIIGKHDLVLDTEDLVSDQLDWDFIVEPVELPHHPEESYRQDDDMPFILADDAGGVWFFWTSSANGLPQTWCRHHNGSDWTAAAEEIPFGAALQPSESLVSVKRPYGLQLSNGDVWLFREVITDLEGTPTIYIGYNTKSSSNPWSPGDFFPLDHYSSFVQPQSDVRPVAIEGRQQNNVEIFWLTNGYMSGTREYFQDIWSAVFDSTDSTWKGYSKIYSRMLGFAPNYPTVRHLYPVHVGNERSGVLFTREKTNDQEESQVFYSYYTDYYWTWQLIMKGDWPGLVPFLTKKLIFCNSAYQDNYDVWYKILNEDNTLSQPIKVEGLPIHNGRQSVVTDEEGQPLIVYINVDLADIETDPEVMNMTHWNIIAKRLITSV